MSKKYAPDGYLKKAAALALVLILVAGAAAAATALFTAGSGVQYETGSGLIVSTGEDHKVGDANPFLDNETVVIGNVTVSSGGAANVSIDQFDGTYTNTSGIVASSNDIDIRHESKKNITVGGSVTALDFKNITINGNTQFVFSSGGAGTVTVYGLSAQTDWYAVYASGDGDIIDQGTTDTNGNATISLSSGTDVGVALITPTGPTALSLSPNGTSHNNENVDASFDVNDSDFATDAGDTVNATVYLNGSPVANYTGLTSNQTVDHTFNDLGDGQHDWYVELEDAYGLNDTSGTASFTVKHYAPVIDNSSAAPTGAQDTLKPDLEINVTDRDFVENSGDSVDVNFTLNGAQVGTDTLTSNRTATIADVSAVGGENTWYVNATDEYGNTTDSQVFTFNAPDSLDIRNETENATGVHELITSADVQVEFYFDRDDEPDLIVDRNTSDGTLNMTGLPVDEPFVVVAAADGYFNRRIFVPSLFETSTVYLLNENETAVQPTFRLIDFTGKYERDTTVLEIQRNINGSWQTVEGDYFGAVNEMTAQLAYNERHRLIIRNVATGETRELGVYTPTATSTVELEVTSEDTIINEQFLPTVQVSPSVSSVPARNAVNFSATVSDAGSEVDSYTVVARLENGTELYNQSFDSAGTENFTLDLAGAEEQSVTVWVNWTTVSGESDQISTTFGIDEFFQNDYSLLTILLGVDMGGETPNTLSSLIVVVLALFATAFASTRMESGYSALTGLSVVTAGALIGWVPFGWLIAGGISWLVFSGVRNRI